MHPCQGRALGGEEQWCCQEGELWGEGAVIAGTRGKGATSLPAPTRERAVRSQSRCPRASCHPKGFPFQHTLILWLPVLQRSSDDSPKVTYLANTEFPCQASGLGCRAQEEREA